MDGALALLDTLQLIVFPVLAIRSGLQWYRYRRPAEGWAAAAFIDLGAVVVAGRILERAPELEGGMASKLLIAVLVVFPYLLYRFGTTFVRPTRLVDAIVKVTSIACVVGVFLFRHLPEEGDPQPPLFRAYVLLIVTHWAGCGILVAYWLWRGGRGRPTVVRRRMRTMAAGSTVLAVALVAAGAAPSGGEATPAAIFVGVLTVMSGPLFLAGVAPPGFVLERWRRDDVEALWATEAGLVKADSEAEVAEILLPFVARVMGADRATLTGPDGTASASWTPSEHEHVASAAATRAAHQELRVAIRDETLVVSGDAFTPFFGRQEEQLLRRIADLADLALRRTRIRAAEVEAADELARASDATRQFVAVASHDLRTPITIIRGYAEMLTSTWDVLPEETKLKYIDTIGRNAGYLATIVGDLLTASRIDAGALEPDAQPVTLRTAVSEVISDLRRVDGIEIDVDERVIVHVDPDHLARIIRNLVENAFTYGSPPVCVRSTPAADGFVELRVRDHGEGVAREFRSQLFEKFARAERAKAVSKQGTGLGLSIVKGLANAAGGDAWYEEPTGPGACFAVRLRVGG